MDLNALLIKNLSGKQVLKTPKIVEAFLKMDRKNFIKPEYEYKAYDDIALPLDAGQTISQPTTVAFMLEQLQPEAGNKVLDVGSGSAWTTALLSHIVGPTGKVYGVEIMPALVEFGRRNLKKADVLNAEIVPAQKTLGYPQQAPYDRILTSAFAKKIPQDLVDQLKEGGIMVLPVKNDIVKVTKLNEDSYKVENYPGFVFVPLIETKHDN